MNPEFEQKLKRLAEDDRYSSEFIGIVVRNHFSASGGVPAPAGEATGPDSDGLHPVGTEAEKLPPAVGLPRGLTAFCGSNRHDACSGAYRESGVAAFVVCPCVCHSGIPELVLLPAGQRREPFSADDLNALDTEWNLCCCCGTITPESQWTYWQAKDDWEDESDKWRPSVPPEGDPMCLCPACGWEHIDLDDGCSGYYSGTWEEMSIQRGKDLPDHGDWWANRLEEVAKGDS